MLWSLVILSSLVVVTPVLLRLSRPIGSVVPGLVSLGLGGWYATKLPALKGGEALRESVAWAPELGLTLSVRLDGLSLLFALLICFIGGLVLLYAGSYMRSDPRRGLFMSILIGFMAAMLGLVLSDNLIFLFVCWELTSITSFLLIGFDHRRESARAAAVQALLVTGIGGLALLAGALLLGFAGGGFEISNLAGEAVRSHATYDAIVVLMLLAAFTKSAIFPFSFWLPGAMEAPSPVSALLHSATMVKAGVYLVARMHPTLGGSFLWDESLAVLGGLTMLLAAFQATRQTKLKPLLAATTVSSLGAIMMLIGIGAPKAAAVYLIAHALFKGCLFLVAGSITKQTGLKEPAKLGGLVRVMPIVTIAGVLGALSMAGMFPLVGFVGKELLIKASLAHPEWSVVATTAVVASGVFMVAASLILMWRTLADPKSEDVSGASDPDWRQWIGPILLALMGLVVGLAPGLFAEAIVIEVVRSMTIENDVPKIKMQAYELLWPPTLATALSGVAIGVGVAMYALQRRFDVRPDVPGWITALTPSGAYTGSLRALDWIATTHTSVVQNGSLQRYVRVCLLAMIGVGGVAATRVALHSELTLSLEGAKLVDFLLIGALAVGAVAATMQRSALASVAALGGVGFMMTLVFALFGAPDVATTQLAVETLIVIIFVLVIFHLPRYSKLTSTNRRVTDALIAGAFGVVMTALTLGVMQRDAPASISSYFAENSVEKGYGRNVVNVILVDFRALDTLGEVFVVGVAAMGVLALLRTRRTSKPGETNREGDPA